MGKIDWRVFFLAAGVVALIVVFSWAGYTSSLSLAHEQDRQTSVDRALLAQSKAIRVVARKNCLDIEQLKRGEREAALKSWRDLDKNLKLLGLKKTPEIVRSARESRDAKLKRYASRVCPEP